MKRLMLDAVRLETFEDVRMTVMRRAYDAKNPTDDVFEPIIFNFDFVSEIARFEGGRSELVVSRADASVKYVVSASVEEIWQALEAVEAKR